MNRSPLQIDCKYNSSDSHVDVIYVCKGLMGGRRRRSVVSTQECTCKLKKNYMRRDFDSFSHLRKVKKEKLNTIISVFGNNPFHFGYTYFEPDIG